MTVRAPECQDRRLAYHHTSHKLTSPPIITIICSSDTVPDAIQLPSSYCLHSRYNTVLKISS